MLSTFHDSQLPSTERRHTVDNIKPLHSTQSRSSSVASTASRKSEPGWMSSLNGIDRSRASSVPSGASMQTGQSAKTSSLKKLFGGKSKEEKEKQKKQAEQTVLTSRHAAAVKTKLALDPKLKQALQKNPGLIMAGTQSSAHLTAQQQELRHPHSGPPALKPCAKADMPALTRILSGDEADEPDDLERAREEWKRRRVPDVNTVDEGESVPTPPEDPEEVNIPDSKVVERQGVRILSVASMDLEADQYRPRPEKKHAQIAGRYQRDEKGVWHK